MSDRRTTTFDFGDGSVENSSFTDIESSADRVVAAGSGRDTVYERIRHRPWRHADRVNWAKVGAMGTLLGVVIAVIALVAS